MRRYVLFVLSLIFSCTAQSSGCSFLERYSEEIYYIFTQADADALVGCGTLDLTLTVYANESIILTDIEQINGGLHLSSSASSFTTPLELVSFRAPKLTYIRDSLSIEDPKIENATFDSLTAVGQLAVLGRESYPVLKRLDFPAGLSTWTGGSGSSLGSLYLGFTQLTTFPNLTFESFKNGSTISNNQFLEHITFPASSLSCDGDSSSWSANYFFQAADESLTGVSYTLDMPNLNSLPCGLSITGFASVTTPKLATANGSLIFTNVSQNMLDLPSLSMFNEMYIYSENIANLNLPVLKTFQDLITYDASPDLAANLWLPSLESGQFLYLAHESTACGRWLGSLCNGSLTYLSCGGDGWSSLDGGLCKSGPNLRVILPSVLVPVVTIASILTVYCYHRRKKRSAPQSAAAVTSVEDAEDIQLPKYEAGQPPPTYAAQEIDDESDEEDHESPRRATVQETR